MSSSKRINYLPAEGRSKVEETPFGAVLITIMACGIILWLSIPSPPPPPVHAETQVSEADFDPDSERGWTLGAEDPLRPYFAQAEHWYPWHRVLASIARASATRGSLQTVSLSIDSQQLEILGSVDELTSVTDLVLDLARWSFLVDAEANDLMRTPGDLRTRFSLRLKVVPLIQRQEAP